MTRVAVVQAASIPFDSAATVAKAEGLIAECATGGAEVAVFPEAFCQAIRASAYPEWYQEEISEDPASFLMRGGSAIADADADADTQRSP